MKTHSKNIELSKLATDPKSEVASMVRELEGWQSGPEASAQGSRSRFILAGAKAAFGSKKAGVRH